VTKPWGYGDLFASAVCVFPLFLLYQVGALFCARVSRLDWVTPALRAALGPSDWGPIAVYVAVLVFFVAWLATQPQHRPNTRTLGLLLLESVIYGASLAVVVACTVDGLVKLQLDVMSNGIVLAIGAGVHEEIAFRLLGFAGLAQLMRRSGIRSAAPIALAFSSLVFAAVHYWGGAADAWSWSGFWFRGLAGAALAAVFWYRSLAHAVYTHILYDLFVILTR
jgi:Type II CAAX prenyl endopeptidase Rce1-like